MGKLVFFNKPGKLAKVLFAAAIIVILVFLGMQLMNILLRPLVLQIAEARVRSVTAQVMNNAILENLNNGITYEDLISVRTDSGGRVTMLQANTAKMNTMAAEIALTAQRNISEMGLQGISIPLGTVVGGQLFAGKGPLIKVTITPVGSVVSTFGSEFESAGINQTRHKIILKLKALVRIIIPGGGTQIEVELSTPISESIIVGIVPDSYVNVPTVDNMLNLVPN